MNFFTDLHLPGTDAGAYEGSLQDAAVKCWFTSAGRALPLSMKIKNETEEIQLIENIQTLEREKQRYAGVLAWKYKCRARVDDQEYFFSLFFYPETCIWKLAI